MPTEFETRILKVFSQIKKAESEFSQFSIPLKLQDKNKGVLRPVIWGDESNQSLITLFTQWRDEHQNAFPTRFKVTVEGTRNWIEKGILGVSTRLLFSIENEQKQQIGHIGIGGVHMEREAFELENVIRGVNDVTPGVMTSAVLSLSDWALKVLKPKEYYLHVFSDNSHAIHFYEKCGFKTKKLLPLVKREESGIIRFVPADGLEKAPDAHFCEMWFQR